MRLKTSAMVVGHPYFRLIQQTFSQNTVTKVETRESGSGFGFLYKSGKRRGSVKQRTPQKKQMGELSN